MTRSRGALSKTLVDREFPFQVMLRNDARHRRLLWDISHMATRLGASPLGHSFYFDEEGSHYSVYCFRSQAAQVFLTAWSGEWLSPINRRNGRWRLFSRLARAPIT